MIEIERAPPLRSMDVSRLKSSACAAIDETTRALQDVSSTIWKNPELAYEEHSAHGLLTDFLKNHGFSVESGYKLDTAFKATFGRRAENGLNIGILCEYDALPDIGHACGHNLIAEAGNLYN